MHSNNVHVVFFSTISLYSPCSHTSFFTSPCTLQCYFSLSSRLHKGGTSHRRKGAFHFTPTRSPLSSLSRWGLLSLPTMGWEVAGEEGGVVGCWGGEQNRGLYQSRNNMSRSLLWHSTKLLSKSPQSDGIVLPFVNFAITILS